MFFAPICASWKYMPFSRIESNTWNKGGGKREREIVVFFLVEKHHSEAKFLVFQYSTKDLNDNKDKDDSIYTSAQSLEDLRLFLLCIPSIGKKIDKSWWKGRKI